MIDREAADELVHIQRRLDRVQEIVERSKDAADCFLQGADHRVGFEYCD